MGPLVVQSPAQRKVSQQQMQAMSTLLPQQRMHLRPLLLWHRRQVLLSHLRFQRYPRPPSPRPQTLRLQLKLGLRRRERREA